MDRDRDRIKSMGHQGPSVVCSDLFFCSCQPTAQSCFPQDAKSYFCILSRNSCSYAERLLEWPHAQFPASSACWKPSSSWLMPVDLRGLLSDRKMNEKICRIQLSMTAPTTTHLVGYFQLCLLLSLTAFIRRLFCFIIMLLLIFFFYRFETRKKMFKKCNIKADSRWNRQGQWQIEKAQSSQKAYVIECAGAPRGRTGTRNMARPRMKQQRQGKISMYLCFCMDLNQQPHS